MALLVLAVGLAAQEAGEHALLAGGGNGGGTGVWILPFAAFECPEGVPHDAQVRVGDGEPFVLTDGCVRIGADLHVLLDGAPIAGALAYYDATVQEGRFHDVASGTYLRWGRV